MWIATARGYLSGLRLNVEKRRGIRIFYYHGVVETKTDPLLERNFNLFSVFQSQLRFLRQFRLLNLTELADLLSADMSIPDQAAIITFDDGHASNLVVAEIMSAARLPWATFIVTGVIGNSSTWPEVLALLMLHGQARKVEALDNVWSLKSRMERESAFRKILVKLKTMPAGLRRHTVEVIREQFPDGEVQRLLQKFPSLQMLSWEDVAQLSNGGVEVGSHGIDHEIHHLNQPAAVRSHELAESKAEIERRLDCSCRFFAFPNGDVVPTSSQEVSAAGYKLAFTTEAYTIEQKANPYLLPRLYAAPSTHEFIQHFFWQVPDAAIEAYSGRPMQGLKDGQNRHSL